MIYPLLAQQFQEVKLGDLLLVLIYLGIVGFLGFLGYRNTKNAADYLLAGRKTHPFIMSLSYGATFISTSAIVGFGGVAGLFGMSLLWLTFLNIFVGVFIAFIVLGGPTRRMGHRLDAHTFPELLGRRYDSKAVQVMAGLIIFCFMPLYAAAVLIGGCEFLTTAFHLDYGMALMIFAVITAIYVFFGGLKGVLYTDTFQGVIMVFGMLFLLISAYVMVGGVSKGHADLTAMKGEAFAGFKAIGQQGWTAMPAFGWGAGKHDLWWIVVSTIVMGVGIGVLAQPQLVVRFLVVKSGRELHRALAVGGLFIILMTGVAFTVGALSNVYFFRHEKIVGRIIGQPERAMIIAKKEPGVEKRVPAMLLHIDTTETGHADTHIVNGLPENLSPEEARKAPPMPKAEIRELPDGRVEVMPHATAFTRAVVWDAQSGAWMFNPDSIIPIYVTSAMPRWFRVLFLLTLLAAAMSTMSSQYHTLGTALGRDVAEQLLPKPKNGADGSARTIYIVRVAIVVGLILAVTIAYFTRGGYFIARATAIFFGLCASAFLPAFVGGLFWKRMTRAAAVASMIVGFTATAFWLVFVKSAEAGAVGLVQKVTGGSNSILAGQGNWAVVDPLLIALPLSILTAVAVTYFTRPPSAEHLEKCFAKSAAPVAPAVSEASIEA